MKELDFLNKLKIEGKLKIVEPSEEIKNSYIEKSESNLSSSKILLDNDKLEESIGLTYYSMYHILTALLFKVGIKCENHYASIILLKKLFDIDNSDIENAKKERIDKQYYTDFNIVKLDVVNAIESAEIFNSKIFDFISRITNLDIENYRKRFNNTNL
ncbi:DNA-binding protein [Candidatus Pacearchaeota archaeon]|nr:DNA-binding protein [Candidatus Pacearchaeota archaeon]